MRFTSLQQKLYQSVSLAERVIGRNLTLPILANTLISTNKESGVLRLCATDLEMGIEVESAAKIDSSGSITVPTKLLSSFIRGLPNVNIECEEKGKKLYIYCGDHKSIIKGESADDFPIIPNINESARDIIEIKAREFLSGIASVLNSASLLEIKPEITGVFIHIEGNTIRFAATDSFRLSEVVATLTDRQKQSQKFIIPRKCCDGILKVFQDNEGKLMILTANSQIAIENELEDGVAPKIRFVGRLIEGDYPDYEQIVPKKFSKIAEIKKDEFVQRIKAASLFSNKLSEVTCAFNQKKQQLEVSAANHEYGDYCAAVPCVITGGDERVVFNFQYLLEGMQHINSEGVFLKLNSASTPALIEPAGSEGFRYLVMPIKTT